MRKSAILRNFIEPIAVDVLGIPPQFQDISTVTKRAVLKDDTAPV
jgi:hypothetical protein